MVRTLLSLVLLVSLVSASCGSNSSVADATTTTADTATAEISTTTEVTTTTEEVEEGSDEAIVMAYCASVRDVDARLDAADFTDPIELEAALTYQIDTIASTEVPREIQDDITTMLTVSDDYYQLLETVDFDLFAVEAEILALFETPAVEAAGQNLDEFEAENCPIVLDDAFETDDNPLELTEQDVMDLLQDPAGRTGIAEGIVASTGIDLEAANCFLDETDPSVVAAIFSIGVGNQTQVDPEMAGGMFEGLAACDLSIDTFG